MRRILLVAICAAYTLGVISIDGEVPGFLSFQGRLVGTEGDPVANGTYSVEFRIYDDEGTELWFEVHSITTADGMFVALLGSSGSPLTASLFSGPERYLGITVESDPEMTPRTPLTSEPFALIAHRADTASAVEQSAISSASISDGTIQFVDLADNGASAGDVIKWNGVNWAPATDETGSGGAGDGWIEIGDVLFTGGEWGIARSGNILYGVHDSTHINLGVRSTTGISSLDVKYSTVTGGYDNDAQQEGSTVGGGVSNSVQGNYGVIAGGQNNHVTGYYSTVGGGEDNWSQGAYATVPGGRRCWAIGYGSFAAGSDAQADHAGTFVWADTGSTKFVSTGANQFLIEARGGVGIGTNSPAYQLDVAGDENVLRAIHNGSDASDYYAVYGESRPQDNYGYGGYFIGGFRGVSAKVEPTGSLSYAGVSGSAHGGSGTNYGVIATTSGSGSNTGVYGSASGEGDNIGVYGAASGGAANWAGWFAGDVRITGTIDNSKATTLLDHPLDPEGKYLKHAAVTSPELKTVYDGTVKLDAGGKATVSLPDYFSALNTDLRYQLTAIGAPGPNLHVSQKVVGNRFVIAGGDPGMEVCWMVTGIRNDAYARANPVEVVTLKSIEEAGKYLHPEAFGLSTDRALSPFSDHETSEVIARDRQKENSNE